MLKSRNNVVQPQKRILCFAREAGGAEAIAPVVKNLGHSYRIGLLAKDFAVPVFQHHNLEYEEYITHSGEAIVTVLRNYWDGQLPDVVLTSATSLPWNDMTERLLWHWAREHAIPSIGVIDQWQNYGLRFSGCNPDEHLAYLPTRITTMDERSREEMISEGIPTEIIAVTGQPALDALFDERQAFTLDSRKTFRDKVGAEPDSFLVLFVSEVMKRDFADSLGYNEETTLEFLLRTLAALIEKTGIKLHLMVKLHPQNTPSDFTGIDFAKARRKFSITLIRQEIQPHPLALASDIVVGMTSVLLVESILLGLPTISITLNSKKDVDLVAVSVGALPWLRTEYEAADAIGRLIMEADFKTRWMERQKTLSVLPNATERVIREVENLLLVNDLTNIGS
ncbi:hypothetical protein ACFLYI_00665 [Chloroflexota bacterium]